MSTIYPATGEEVYDHNFFWSPNWCWCHWFYLATDTAVFIAHHPYCLWQSCFHWSLVPGGTRLTSVIQSACRNLDDVYHLSCICSFLENHSLCCFWRYCLLRILETIRLRWISSSILMPLVILKYIFWHMLCCKHIHCGTKYPLGYVHGISGPQQPCQLYLLPFGITLIWVFSNYQWNCYWFLLSILPLNLWEVSCNLW